MLEIRKELPVDFQQVRELTIEAFGNSEFGYQGEADLIELIRKECKPIVSIVAHENERIVGHAMFSPVTFEHLPFTVGMALAPISVAIDSQGRGIGTRLIETGIEILKDEKCTHIVVVGHPTYYAKFGFKLASDFGLEHGFSGIPQSVFFAMELVENSHDDVSRGIQVRYSSCFGPQFEHSDG